MSTIRENERKDEKSIITLHFVEVVDVTVEDQQGFREVVCQPAKFEQKYTVIRGKNGKKS